MGHSHLPGLPLSTEERNCLRQPFKTSHCLLPAAPTAPWGDPLDPGAPIQARCSDLSVLLAGCSISFPPFTAALFAHDPGQSANGLRQNRERTGPLRFYFALWPLRLEDFPSRTTPPPEDGQYPTANCLPRSRNARIHVHSLCSAIRSPPYCISATQGQPSMESESLVLRIELALPCLT